MIPLLILSIFSIVTVAAWTYWLMMKVIRPNDAGTTQLQQLNDRMLRMLEAGDQRQVDCLDRLFSASASMQSLANQLAQKALRSTSGHTDNPPKPATTRIYRDRDDDEADDAAFDPHDQEKQYRDALEEAHRREELQEAGAIGVPAGEI